MTHGDLHPNDGGYAVIAKRMNAALAQLGIRVWINAETADAMDAPQVICSSG